jgi:hypothetical protein
MAGIFEAPGLPRKIQKATKAHVRRSSVDIMRQDALNSESWEYLPARCQRGRVTGPELERSHEATILPPGSQYTGQYLIRSGKPIYQR